MAAANQNFLITERRRHYLRYAGALTFFEINGPSVYKVGMIWLAPCFPAGLLLRIVWVWVARVHMW
jgi:hypothetical protein